MDALSPLVSGGTNIGLTNPYSLDVSMIGRQDHFKSTLKQRVQQTPKRSSLGPVPNPRVQTIGSGYNAVQHLINCAHDDACNPTPGLINLFLHPSNENVILF